MNMKAMILAAGRGERLRPITDTLPKALVTVRKKPLIIHHLIHLAEAGFQDIIINIAYRGDQIKQAIHQWQPSKQLNIIYSHECDGALETGGGIVNALPLLGNRPFFTVNADIFTDFNFADLRSIQLTPSILAHLILVPQHNTHMTGDFSLNDDFLSNALPRPYTAAGITVYHPLFFAGLSVGKYSVVPHWRQYADTHNIRGSVYHGLWHDIGTMEKLNALQ